MTARVWHRWLGAVVGLLLLYLGVSGTVVQMIDLATILRHAPARAPDMIAMRESIDGPGNYAVIVAADDDAAPLPPGYDAIAALTRGFAATGGRKVSWLELRMAGGQPVVQAQVGEQEQRYAAISGSRLADPPPPPHGQQSSNHLSAKNWHRLHALGDGILWLNALAGIALGAMVLLGLVVWYRLYRARYRMGRTALFWPGGGTSRGWHRGLAIVAALPLLVVAVSGTILSIDSLMMAVYRLEHPDRILHGMAPVGMIADYSRPLSAGEIAPMARTTLAAFAAADPARPIKALRLRYFAGYAQGVIIAGGDQTGQLVFDARSGRRLSMSEPGYPDTVFPTGWEWHERLKRIHRGDFFGPAGRWLSLLAGLSLTWFAASGLWMYYGLWERRARKGRMAVLWR